MAAFVIFEKERGHVKVRSKILRAMFFIAVPLIVIGLIYFNQNNFLMREYVDYTQAIEMIKSGEVEAYEVNMDTGQLTFNTKDKQYKSDISTIDIFREDLGDCDVSATFVRNPNYSSAITLVSTCVFIIIGVALYRRMSNPGKSDMEFTKMKGSFISSQKKILFSDVAGADEEKGELEEVVRFLKDPEKFTKAGARIPRGILLVGPPGTGKTLLARAVAGEADVPFFSVSGSDFVEMFVGVGASRVRNLFNQAKKRAPAIVFIDEIDAVGRQRGTGIGGGHDEREQTLNQILVEMDGFAKDQGVIVMAATNRPDVLDKALLRPGRFDRQVVVNLPDIKGREAILAIHAKNKKFDSDVTLASIAAGTTGFSGADLENLLNEAALLSIRDGRSSIAKDDIDNAILKVAMGSEKKSAVISDMDKKITAYHEAGHAIVARCLKTQDPVHQISIIPRGMAAGFTLYRPKEDRSHVSGQYLRESISSLLGGRAAEEMIFEQCYSGASNDIERATQLARDMVVKYGMSSLGPIHLSDGGDTPFLGRSVAEGRACSEDLLKQVDVEVRKIIADQYRDAKHLLEDHYDTFVAVAERLYCQEKLTGEEFERIFSGKDGLKCLK